ncbi:MAG: PilZ domain-containing protein [Rhodospirillales bacterium]
MYVAANQHIARPTRYPYHKPAEGKFGGTRFNGEIDNVSATGAAVTLGDAGIAVDNGMFVDMHVEGLGHLKGSVARTYDGGFAVEFDETGTDLDALAEKLRHLDHRA